MAQRPPAFAYAPDGGYAGQQPYEDEAAAGSVAAAALHAPPPYPQAAGPRHQIPVVYGGAPTYLGTPQTNQNQLWQEQRQNDPRWAEHPYEPRGPMPAVTVTAAMPPPAADVAALKNQLKAMELERKANEKEARDAARAQEKALKDAARAQEKAIKDAERAQEKIIKDAEKAREKALKDAARAEEREATKRLTEQKRQLEREDKERQKAAERVQKEMIRLAEMKRKAQAAVYTKTGDPTVFAPAPSAAQPPMRMPPTQWRPQLPPVAPQPQAMAPLMGGDSSNPYIAAMAMPTEEEAPPPRPHRPPPLPTPFAEGEPPLTAMDAAQRELARQTAETEIHRAEIHAAQMRERMRAAVPETATATTISFDDIAHYADVLEGRATPDGQMLAAREKEIRVIRALADEYGTVTGAPPEQLDRIPLRGLIALRSLMKERVDLWQSAQWTGRLYLGGVCKLATHLSPGGYLRPLLEAVAGDDEDAESNLENVDFRGLEHLLAREPYASDIEVPLQQLLIEHDFFAIGPLGRLLLATAALFQQAAVENATIKAAGGGTTPAAAHAILTSAADDGVADAAAAADDGAGVGRGRTHETSP